MLKKEKVEGFYFVIYPVFKNCASLFPTTPGTYIITTVKRGVRKIHYIGASSNIQCRIKTHNKIIELKKMLKKGEVIEILIRAAILLVGRKLENVLLSKLKPPLNSQRTCITQSPDIIKHKFAIIRYIEKKCKKTA